MKDMYNCIEIAKKAGDAIMQIYNKDLNIKYKDDNSPLTVADLASHHIISLELNRCYPYIPILSEESFESFILSDENLYFWCVDPLDGTKEFIKKNDEFTVNIALIENQKPVLGVIGVPAKNTIYAAVKDGGAFKKQGMNELQPLKVKNQHPNKLTFAVSRSHLDSQTKDMVEEYQAEILKVGSSLKLAYVSEGLIDIYPRFGPTMLWDLAAGQCLIEEAGGKVLRIDNQQPITYNINQMKNSSFIAVNETLKKKG